MRVFIDFSIGIGPSSEAWGMIDGELDLPNLPSVADKVTILSDSGVLAALAFPAALRVEDVSNMRDQSPDWDRPVDTVVMLEDVFLPDELAASRVAWVLWRELGLDATRWKRQISQEWLAPRGRLRDARVVAVEREETTLRLCLNEEWANEPMAEYIGGPGDLVFVHPQVVEGDLAACEGGQINEVTLIEGPHLILDFSDRERLKIACSEVLWDSYGAPSV